MHRLHAQHPGPMNDIARRIGLALLVTVLFVPALTTVRGLVAQARAARALRERSADERRRIVLGSWYAVVDEVRRRVPEGGSVDIVMPSPDARDVAVFAGAGLAPRDCRFFSGWDDWRARRRATFVHDARGANAPAGPAPGPASCVIVAEPRLDPPLRIVQ